jgi:hypothetical protein
MRVNKWSVKVLAIVVMAFLVTLSAGCGGGGGGSDSDDVESDVVAGDDGREPVAVDDADDDADADAEAEVDDLAGNEFTGVWRIQKEDSSSLWIFNDDGTFIKKRADEPLDGATHFVGTYAVSEGELSGSFTNPGVGAGEIRGSITMDGTLLMDFIEYWHTPPKVVPTVGVRQ